MKKKSCCKCPTGKEIIYCGCDCHNKKRNTELKKLIKLWDELGNIPINNNDKIELSFQTPSIIFPKGTDRFEIWRWFDNLLGYIAPEYTLNDLMYHKIKGV